LHDYHRGWLIIAKQLIGQPKREIFELVVSHEFTLQPETVETVA